MNAKSKRSVALALSLMTLIVTGCSATDKRLAEAAATQGRAQAGVTIPDQPDDCRVQEPHAAITVGSEL